MGADPVAPGDRELRTRLAGGDPRALGELYGSWGPTVHGCARAVVGTDRADAVTRRVFVDAWLRRQDADPLVPLSLWLLILLREEVSRVG